MASSVTYPPSTSIVDNWRDACDESQQLVDFKALVTHYSPLFSFEDITTEFKAAVCSFVIDSFYTYGDIELQKLKLELLRILFRDKSSVDLKEYEALATLLIKVACLEVKPVDFPNVELLMEAQKCLINLSFNSECSRSIFASTALEQLTSRLLTCYKVLASEKLEESDFLVAFTEMLPIQQLKELLFYDVKIAFIISAKHLTVRKAWNKDTRKARIFLDITLHFKNLLKAHSKNLKNQCAFDTTIPSECLSTLFNILCHGEMEDKNFAEECAKTCVEMIEQRELDFNLKQHCVNLLAVLSVNVGEFCPKVSINNELNKCVYEGSDMAFAESILTLFEEALDKLGHSDSLGTFLTVMIHLCTQNKAARRYCRMKIIPPLTAKEVDRPPEEGDTLRNKIVRLMQAVTNVNYLASELLFILCKRSVNRMIKYCGFGHSAGLLANYGFLGKSQQRSASDSEDSETEDYRRVEDSVNPVTGYIPDPARLEEIKRQLASMSDEQKEYEAVKLANALDKLLNEGVLAPATIGEDGRPKQVGHVAELMKDAKVEEPPESDGD